MNLGPLYHRRSKEGWTRAILDGSERHEFLRRAHLLPSSTATATADPAHWQRCYGLTGDNGRAAPKGWLPLFSRKLFRSRGEPIFSQR